MSENKCSCSSDPKLIFPCSGASNVGEIADHAARQLTSDGVGRMYCLAGIGGRVSGIIASTESAGKILAIDGCPSDCAKNTLLQAGFNEFDHVRVTDLGLIKGGSPVNEENVDKVPGVEGVLQLLDENKMVLAIIGTANLREALEEYLENEKICYFGYEEEPMYTSRESQLIQQFLQEHGRLPEGVGDLDDLF